MFSTGVKALVQSVLCAQVTENDVLVEGASVATLNRMPLTSHPEKHRHLLVDIGQWRSCWRSLGDRSKNAAPVNHRYPAHAHHDSCLIRTSYLSLLAAVGSERRRKCSERIRHARQSRPTTGGGRIAKSPHIGAKMTRWFAVVKT